MYGRPGENVRKFFVQELEYHMVGGKITFTFAYPLTMGVIGAPQMTSQPVSWENKQAISNGGVHFVLSPVGISNDLQLE